jgi:hypothetical protein
VRPGRAVGHANTARVDHPAPGGKPVKLHVGVPADHGLDAGIEPGQRRFPPLHRAVGQQHLVVAARRGVTEHGRAEAVDINRHRQRQPVQQVAVPPANLDSREAGRARLQRACGGADQGKTLGFNESS